MEELKWDKGCILKFAKWVAIQYNADPAWIPTEQTYILVSFFDPYS